LWILNKKDMLKNIFDILNVVEGETENIRIAQGKYKLPETFKEGLQHLKQEICQLKK